MLPPHPPSLTHAAMSTASRSSKRHKPAVNSLLIAISGSSRSGKSTLANEMLTRLREDSIAALLVQQDSYMLSHAERLPCGRETWEGPQFTNWSALYDGVIHALERASVVLLEGYTILDAVDLHPALGSLLGRVVWVSSTKEQVIQRRDSYPEGWPDGRSYAAECVWPAHEEYERRVLTAGSALSITRLPATGSVAERLQIMHDLVARWMNSSVTSSPSSLAAGAAASSSSSSSADTLPPDPPTIPTYAPDISRAVPVVLVSHGSFNPVHCGHIDMMVRAKAFLESRGFTVAKGVLAITKAAHIQRKGTVAMSDAARLRLLEYACAPHDAWLTHCDGLGVRVTSARRYAREYASRSPLPRRMAIVLGSDVYLRYGHTCDCDAPLLVVVPREEELEAARPRRDQASTDQQVCIEILPPSDMGSRSSTLVREAMQYGDCSAIQRMCGAAVAAGAERGGDARRHRGAAEAPTAAREAAGWLARRAAARAVGVRGAAGRAGGAVRALSDAAAAGAAMV